jgi:hypothetical protein
MRARSSVLGLALWLFAPPAAAGEPTTIRVEFRGVIAAPLQAVEETVGDMLTYPDWVPVIRRAFVADGGTVETHLKLPWPIGELHELVRMRRQPLGRGAVVLTWEQVRGDLARDEGVWRLVPLGRSLTEVTYSATFQLRHWIPAVLIHAAERRAAPKLFRNLAAYVARRSAGAMLRRAASGPAPKASIEAGRRLESEPRAQLGDRDLRPAHVEHRQLATAVVDDTAKRDPVLGQPAL